MIQSLRLENFTVFEQAEFQFSPGVNVLIGENGTGKTQALKIGYAVLPTFNIEEREACFDPNFYEIEGYLTIVPLYAEEMKKVFKINQLSHVSRKKSQKSLLTIEMEHSTISHKLSLEVEPIADKLSVMGHKACGQCAYYCIFIPAKETLSIYPNFIPLYEKYHLSFDKTYYDLCKALQNPLLKKLGDAEQAMLNDLETILGGQVVLNGDRFYLKFSGTENLTDINMVAEGHRKIAMLAYLIANDSIKKGTTLFWDEPETNLNPRLMRQLAGALAALAKYGVQVILATHSYFLMKEFSLLAQQDQSLPVRFFGLALGENGAELEQSDRLTDLRTVALDEELAQYEREQALHYTGEPA